MQNIKTNTFEIFKSHIMSELPFDNVYPPTFPCQKTRHYPTNPKYYKYKGPVREEVYKHDNLTRTQVAKRFKKDSYINLEDISDTGDLDSKNREETPLQFATKTVENRFEEILSDNSENYTSYVSFVRIYTMVNLLVNFIIYSVMLVIFVRSECRVGDTMFTICNIVPDMFIPIREANATGYFENSVINIDGLVIVLVIFTNITFVSMCFMIIFNIVNITSGFHKIAKNPRHMNCILAQEVDRRWFELWHKYNPKNMLYKIMDMEVEIMTLLDRLYDNQKHTTRMINMEEYKKVSASLQSEPHLQHVCNPINFDQPLDYCTK